MKKWIEICEKETSVFGQLSGKFHLFLPPFNNLIIRCKRNPEAEQCCERIYGSYLQPWYRRTYGYAPGKCSNAEEFYIRALSLALYPSISDADVEKVINALVNLSVANSSA